MSTTMPRTLIVISIYHDQLSDLNTWHCLLICSSYRLSLKFCMLHNRVYSSFVLDSRFLEFSFVSTFWFRPISPQLSWVDVMTDGQSAPLWDPWPDFTFSVSFFRKIALVFVLGRSLWREDESCVVCLYIRIDITPSKVGWTRGKTHVMSNAFGLL
jgi:hypothetical protein